MVILLSVRGLAVARGELTEDEPTKCDYLFAHLFAYLMSYQIICVMVVSILVIYHRLETGK